jgi:hypothetical protein
LESVRDHDFAAFLFVQHTDDATLSFFRLFPDVDTAKFFRCFLSGRCVECQNFLLLFLTSDGFRWRFFTDSRRGASCPKCGATFWSWEHFLSCPFFPVCCSVPEFTAITVLCAWDELLAHIRRVTLLWLGGFDSGALGISSDDVKRIFV